MVMFMISGVLLSEAGHAVSLDDRARVAETRYAPFRSRKGIVVYLFRCVLELSDDVLRFWRLALLGAGHALSPGDHAILLVEASTYPFLPCTFLSLDTCVRVGYILFAVYLTAGGCPSLAA